MANQTLEINPADLNSMIELMDTYGDSIMYVLCGKNENGETVFTSIYKDKIITTTLQSNGWERENTYYRDGTSEEIYSK
jgi:hypothetical protein